MLSHRIQSDLMNGNPVTRIKEASGRSLTFAAKPESIQKSGHRWITGANRILRTLVAAGVLAMGSGCATTRVKQRSLDDGPEYSLIHLTGKITSIPNPKHWPGQLRIKAPVDLWITVDNRSKDTDPDNPNRGRYLLDEIPESWRIKIGGVGDFGYPTVTTAPFLLVNLSPSTHQGYGFESGYITSPPDLPQHRSLLVTATLKSGQAVLANDELPLTEIPVESFDKIREIRILATNRATGAVETITARVIRFKVRQTRP